MCLDLPLNSKPQLKLCLHNCKKIVHQMINRVELLVGDNAAVFWVFLT